MMNIHFKSTSMTWDNKEHNLCVENSESLMSQCFVYINVTTAGQC